MFEFALFGVRRLVHASVLGALLALGAGTAAAGPITFDTWWQFSFTDAGIAAAGCDPADPAGGFCTPSSGTPTSFLDAPAWTFTAAATGAQLTVLDAFLSGDRFEVFDFGVSLGPTSAPVLGTDCGDDPVDCLAQPAISRGVFLLAAGAHSLTIVATEAPDFGGSGYLQVVGAVAVISEPTSLALSSLALAGIGATRLHRRRHDKRSAA